MKIEKVIKATVHHFEIFNDINQIEYYTRYGENNWWINLGNESYPVFYDNEIEKLEELFKEFLK